MPPVGTSILSSNRPIIPPIPTPSNNETIDKKMSHKLAEQGRRNRMNIAIQELDKLIPEKMKIGITVPSKATTVELGCKYINELLTMLNNKDNDMNLLLNIDNNHTNTNVTSSGIESISPLETHDIK